LFELSFFLISTKDLGGKGKSHNLFNASSSTARPKNEILPPEQQIPQLVQCKSNSYHLQIPQLQYSTCSTTIILHDPQISFFVYQPKIWKERGKSEEKVFHAVNSKQKSNKNLFLVGSFLMCCLAGPFH
jgi:hypothetical protein